MFPVLFNLGPLEVQSYYVLWTTALCLFVLTSRRRAVARYGLDYDDVTDVLFWVFLGCLVGARLGGYGDYWSYYVAHPEKILRVWEGAMSSGPAFLGGGWRDSGGSAARGFPWGPSRSPWRFPPPGWWESGGGGVC